jgi:hypothetical protein
VDNAAQQAYHDEMTSANIIMILISFNKITIFQFSFNHYHFFHPRNPTGMPCLPTHWGHSQATPPQSNLLREEDPEKDD